MHLKWFATVNTNVGDLWLVSRCPLLHQLLYSHSLPRQHIRHGESCAAQHGHINCPTHIVPGCKWRNRNCHQTSWESRPETPVAFQTSRLNGLLTLTMPRDNSANWVASWTAAQSQPATKSVKHRKRFCFCHVLKKDLVRLRMNDTKSIIQTFRVFPTKTTGLNTGYSFEADDRQSTRERTLSGPWLPVALDVSP